MVLVLPVKPDLHRPSRLGLTPPQPAVADVQSDPGSPWRQKFTLTASESSPVYMRNLTVDSYSERGYCSDHSWW